MIRIISISYAMLHASCCIVSEAVGGLSYFLCNLAQLWSLYVCRMIVVPPGQYSSSGLVPHQLLDAFQVTHLLSNYLSKFQLAPVLNEDEVEHFLMPVEGVIDSYVVESAGQTSFSPVPSVRCIPFLIV